MTLGEGEFLLARLIAEVQTRLGLRLQPAVKGLVADAAKGLVQSGESPSLAALYQRVQTFDPNDAAVRALVAAASVKETSFYRAPLQLQALEKHLVESVLPVLRRRGERQWRFWSAGCSTGEEGYTLALMARKIDPRFRLQVVGTDMNERSLELARTGCYGARSLRAIPAELLAQHFTPTEKGYQIHEELRAGVTFHRHNFVQDPLPNVELGLMNLDLIVCRNVLIYVDPAHLHGLWKRFRATLRPGGSLLVSATEYAIAAAAEGFQDLGNGLLVRS